MTSAELHADTLHRNAEMLKMSLADFSDADFLERPCAGANHVNWQLGHLIGAESFMISAMGGAVPELPAGFRDRYAKQTSTIDDPAKFAKKDELLALFDRVRAATVQFAKNAKPEDLDKPGPEPIKRLAPTVGHTILMTAMHTNMHLGQIQVLRRKLGKPVLF